MQIWPQFFSTGQKEHYICFVNLCLDLLEELWQTMVILCNSRVRQSSVSQQLMWLMRFKAISTNLMLQSGLQLLQDQLGLLCDPQNFKLQPSPELPPDYGFGHPNPDLNYKPSLSLRFWLVTILKPNRSEDWERGMAERKRNIAWLYFPPENETTSCLVSKNAVKHSRKT